jgi:hypothetical protein
MNRNVNVQEALRHVDDRALSRMGRRGGKASAEVKRFTRVCQEIYATALKEDITRFIAWQSEIFLVSEDGDVLPPI